MKYVVLLHKSKYGHDVHVPALPGCISQGSTEEEALENIKDAIEVYLGMVKEELAEGDVKEREVEVALG